MYQNIDKAFEEIAQGQVFRKRKSPLAAIVWIAAGLVAAFSGQFIPAVAANNDTSSAMMILGWSAVLFGAIKLVIVLGGNAWDFFYRPTGEKIKQYELSYDTENKGEVIGHVTAGRFDKLAGLPRSSIASVKVSFYAVGGRDVLWAQVLEFVPHTHEPVTGVIRFEKGECPLPPTLA